MTSPAKLSGLSSQLAERHKTKVNAQSTSTSAKSFQSIEAQINGDGAQEKFSVETTRGSESFVRTSRSNVVARGEGNGSSPIAAQSDVAPAHNGKSAAVPHTAIASARNSFSLATPKPLDLASDQGSLTPVDTQPALASTVNDLSRSSRSRPAPKATHNQLSSQIKPQPLKRQPDYAFGQSRFSIVARTAAPVEVRPSFAVTQTATPSVQSDRSVAIQPAGSLVQDRLPSAITQTAAAFIQSNSSPSSGQITATPTQNDPSPDTNSVATPIVMPRMPDLPPLPPVRYDPSATPVLDPTTGTNAPPGYASWAQYDEDCATIAARNHAMHAYFEQVSAVITLVLAGIPTPSA